MRITPLDVRKQEFNKSMRGFDCDEVQAFLQTLADEYEAVLIDSKQIRERVMEQDEKISEYTELEKTLRDTLMTAERVMQDTKETASQKGDLIIQEAEFKAKSILEECRVRTEELRREIVSLRKEKENYLGRFRSLAQAQIQFIDTHESDFEEMDKRLLDIVDNVAVAVKPTDFAAPKALEVPKMPETVKMPEVPKMPAAPQVVAPLPEVASFEPAPENNAGSSVAFDAPAVAPTPTPAPVSSENDVWRNYSPGTSNDSQATPEVAATESWQNQSESFESLPESENSLEDNEGKIADILTESLTESNSDPAEELVDFITSDVVKPKEEVEAPHETFNV